MSLTLEQMKTKKTKKETRAWRSGLLIYTYRCPKVELLLFWTSLEDLHL